MKKTIFSTALIFALLIGGCAKFTEIEPKGKNLLNTAVDLDMLLNHDYQGFNIPSTVTLTNAVYTDRILIPGLITDPVKTVKYAHTVWDESVNRVALAESDATYEEVYKIIGTICNPVISRADAVSDDRNLARRIKAEAYVLRAWFHYLAVNLYAKAYDPATAASDPGVAYSFDTDIIGVPLKKYTVEEVYNFILRDLESALVLDALPAEGVNQQRVGESFAYAVQAKVLMSVRRYGDALAAASKSLAINSQVDDHNDMLVTKNSAQVGVIPNPLVWERPQFGSREDLFVTMSSMLQNGITAEMYDVLDPLSVLVRHMPSYRTLGHDQLGNDYGNTYYGICANQLFRVLIKRLIRFGYILGISNVQNWLKLGIKYTA